MALTTVSNAPAPPTLLLVDDEAPILSSLRRLFRPHGYRVLTAEGGDAALACSANEPIDLVISDMRMPGMDGAQFLEQMRARQPDAVRILLTGYADIGSTIAAVNHGQIHRYIAKPWDDQDVLLTVREALARRRLEQQNRELAALTARQNEELKALNAGLEARVKARTAEIEQINDMLEAAYAELKSNFTLSIRVFAGLMELRHRGMSGHSLRVAHLAQQVCKLLALDERASHDIHQAALLHDIGKIGFPDALLDKPVSRMNADELARYRRHPLQAEAALMPLAPLHGVAKAIRGQLERYDGKGFPDGTAGEDIPLGARVISPIIDYENLRAGQLAEQKYKSEEAQAAIRRAAGTRYDPAVVDALIQALQHPVGTDEDVLHIDATDLKAEMVLALDLVSAQGTLLLAAGHVFDARVVRQVKEYVQREGVRLTLHVKRDSAGGIPIATGPATLEAS